MKMAIGPQATRPLKRGDLRNAGPREPGEEKKVGRNRSSAVVPKTARIEPQASEYARAAVEFAAKTIEATASSAGNALKAVGKVLPDPIGGALKAAGENLTSAGKSLGKALEKIGGPVANWFTALAKVVSGGLDRCLGAFEKAAAKVWNKFNSPLDKAWEVLRKWSNEADDWLRANSGTLALTAQITCMFVPVLQVVSLALALQQGAQGLQELYEGGRGGDWKKALRGTILVTGSLAGGADALAKGALGTAASGLAEGLEKAAKVARSAADLARGVVEGLDARESGDNLGAIGRVAGAFAGAADLVGDGLALAAEKVSKYAREAKAAYQAWRKGDLEVGLTLASDLACAGEAPGVAGKLPEKAEKTVQEVGEKAFLKTAEKGPDVFQNFGRRETSKLANQLLEKTLRDALKLNDQAKVLELLASGLETWKILERESARRLAQAQSELRRLEEAGRSGNFKKIQEASSNLSLITGLLSSREVRELSQDVEQFKKVLETAKNKGGGKALKLGPNPPFDRMPDLNALQRNLSLRIKKNLNGLESSLAEGKPALAENIAFMLARDLQFESMLRGY